MVRKLECAPHYPKDFDIPQLVQEMVASSRQASPQSLSPMRPKEHTVHEWSPYSGSHSPPTSDNQSWSGGIRADINIPTEEEQHLQENFGQLLYSAMLQIAKYTNSHWYQITIYYMESKVVKI